MNAAIRPERWRPVVGYEGRYEVSDLGRVRSSLPCRGLPVPRLLRSNPNAEGYLCVSLYQEGSSQRTSRVHRLVAAAFLGPCPPGQEVRHRDGDRRNPVLTNLAYGTQSENTLDSVRHGTHNMASKDTCPQGHSYDRIRASDNARECRTCRCDSSARYRARKASA